MKLSAEEIQLMKEIIGQNISYYREKLVKKTQRELAERARIDDKHLGTIERGEKMPGSGTLAQIAAALGVSTNDLVEGVEHIHKIKPFDD